MTTTHWSRGESTVLEEPRDGLPTSEVTGLPPDEARDASPDTPVPLEGAPTAEGDTSVGEHQPTYQSDLRGLVALVRQRETMAPPPEPPGLEAPPSVREAIRVAGAVLPTPAPAPAQRLRLAAVPVIALAVVGIALGVTRRSAPGPAQPALTVTPVMEASSSIPPPVEASSPPEQSVAEPAPVDRAPSAPVAPAPAAVAKSHTPSTPARRHPSPAAPTAPAAPAPTTPPELPSLMDAITDAVRSSPTAPAHR